MIIRWNVGGKPRIKFFALLVRFMKSFADKFQSCLHDKCICQRLQGLEHHIDSGYLQAAQLFHHDLAGPIAGCDELIGVLEGRDSCYAYSCRKLINVPIEWLDGGSSSQLWVKLLILNYFITTIHLNNIHRACHVSK